MWIPICNYCCHFMQPQHACRQNSPKLWRLVWVTCFYFLSFQLLSLSVNKLQLSKCSSQTPRQNQTKEESTLLLFYPLSLAQTLTGKACASRFLQPKCRMPDLSWAQTQTSELWSAYGWTLLRVVRCLITQVSFCYVAIGLDCRLGGSHDALSSSLPFSLSICTHSCPIHACY